MRPTTTLFVVNFDVERTRQRDLEDYFGQWGRLVRVQIRRNFAFVEFETVDQATAALKAAHLARLGSRTISCEYVVRGGARGGGGGGGRDEWGGQAGDDRRGGRDDDRSGRGRDDYRGGRGRDDDRGGRGRDDDRGGRYRRRSRTRSRSPRKISATAS